MTLLVRYRHDGRVHLGAQHDESVSPLPFETLAAALREHVDNLREHVERVVRGPSLPLGSVEVLAPVDAQEVWAAGDRDGERPELYFKCNGQRVVGPGCDIGVRADSGRNLPASDIAAILTAHGEVAGWTIADALTARSIDDPGQARTYARCCALGPGVRPAWELPPEPVFELDMGVRRDSELVAQGSVDSSRMPHGFAELIAWLTRALDFPDGAVLLGGAGVVANGGFTLQPGDEVSVTVPGIGTLRNPVVRVGSSAPIPRTVRATVSAD